MATITKTYPRTGASVAKARAFVRAHLPDDDAYLLASEAAQNAVRHGLGADFTVTITPGTSEVRVTVTNDGAAVLPPVIDTTFTDLDATGGRGLPLLAALAPAYGITTTGGRTSVWFAFPNAATHLSRAA